MTRMIAVAGILLTASAALASPLLPPCGPGLDGQVASGGCECGYDRGGLLAGRAAGWRWSCDLLRGPGAEEPVPSAGPPGAGLPPGFVYSPQSGAQGNGANAMGY